MDLDLIIDKIIIPLVVTLANLFASRKWIGNVKTDFKNKLNDVEVELKNCIKASRPYRAAFEDALDAMLVVNSFGDIVMMNSAAEFLTGWARSNLVNKPIEELVPDFLVPMHQIWRDGYTERPQHRMMGINKNVYLKRSDGRRIHVDIDLNPEMTENNEVNILVTMREVRKYKIEETQPIKTIDLPKNDENA